MTAGEVATDQQTGLLGDEADIQTSRQTITPSIGILAFLVTEILAVKIGRIAQTDTSAIAEFITSLIALRRISVSLISTNRTS